jgi:hypothetical protein
MHRDDLFARIEKSRLRLSLTLRLLASRDIGGRKAPFIVFPQSAAGSGIGSGMKERQIGQLRPVRPLDIVG